MLIRIVPIGNVPQKVLENLIEGLESALDAKFRLMLKIELPQEAYNRFRRQYDAEKLIEILSKSNMAKFIERSIPTLGITEHDIYYNGLNFVFGLEDPRGCCIISTARLKPEFYSQKPNFGVLVDRTIKEAVHEIGHNMGLDHCIHPFCVMSFSPSADDIDKKNKEFCNSCKMRLRSKGVALE